MRPALRQILLGDGQNYRTSPLRIATFGDSTATFSSLTTTDVSAWNMAFGAGTNQMTITSQKLFAAGLYQQAYIVADGGISGQTTTQMLARSGNSASSTRKAIEDVIALSPDVVLLRGGSINDLIAFAPPITQANINSVVANHLQIVSKFTAAGILVIDFGIYGYSAATNTAQVQAAIVSFNTAVAAAAGNKHKFFDPRGITHDGTGAYISGMSADGTHLQNKGSLVIGQLEASALVSLFGSPRGVRYPGVNVIPNFDLSSSSNVSIGVQGTGWSISATSATRANAKIETINGITYQTCEFTPTADSATGQILIPFGVTGASPTIVISAGQIYGLEFDFIIQGLSGGVPSAGFFNARMDLFKGTPRNLYSALEDSTTDAYGASLAGHAIFNPITIPDFGGSQANLTSSDFRLFWGLSGTGNQTAFKMGLGNPRMVLIG